LAVGFAALFALPAHSTESTTVRIERGESGLSGVVIEVIDTRSGFVLGSEITDDSGRAIFADLPTGVNLQAQTEGGREISVVFVSGDEVLMRVDPKSSEHRDEVSDRKGWDLSTGFGLTFGGNGYGELGVELDDFSGGGVDTVFLNEEEVKNLAVVLSIDGRIYTPPLLGPASKQRLFLQGAVLIHAGTDRTRGVEVAVVGPGINGDFDGDIVFEVGPVGWSVGLGYSYEFKVANRGLWIEPVMAFAGGRIDRRADFEDDRFISDSSNESTFISVRPTLLARMDLVKIGPGYLSLDVGIYVDIPIGDDPELRVDILGQNSQGNSVSESYDVTFERDVVVGGSAGLRLTFGNVF
jgi:hypothetical protein